MSCSLAKKCRKLILQFTSLHKYLIHNFSKKKKSRVSIPLSYLSISVVEKKKEKKCSHWHNSSSQPQSDRVNFARGPSYPWTVEDATSAKLQKVPRE